MEFEEMVGERGVGKGLERRESDEDGVKLLLS